jgi:serine/threonine-protein kinase CTR1
MHSAVAIKQLSGDLSLKAIRALKEEAAVMANLRSDFIVPFTGMTCDPDTGTFGIVMKYLPNGSLYHLLHSDTPVAWSVRYRMAQEVAFGLHYLHSLRPPLLHRDVKSLNVLLTNHW